MKQSLKRPEVVIAILLLTFSAFVIYVVRNPSVKQQLQNTSPVLITQLLALYLLTVVALLLINSSTLKLCKVRLKLGENILLTCYSAVINFFGPLQSGPAFRAVYLKQKHALKLKNYTAATFVYYIFYGFFSGLFLLSGLLKWWTAALVTALVVAAIAGRYYGRNIKRFEQLDLNAWYYLALATLLQICLVTAIYYLELSKIAPGTTLSQAIIYTGAANLSLYVSLTPGAIGFRETFLLFSQNLHGISTSTIVAANILDRVIYLLLLGIMGIVIISMHAKKQLGINST